MQIKVPIGEQFRIQIYIKLQCDLVMNDCQCDERLYNQVDKHFRFKQGWWADAFDNKDITIKQMN